MYDAVHGEFAEEQHADGPAAVSIAIRCSVAGPWDSGDWMNAWHWIAEVLGLARVQSQVDDMHAPRCGYDACRG